MRFLRTLFWVVLAVLGVLFATANWKPVTIDLWSGVVVDTYLPVLMLATFLLGLIPMLVLHRASRWSLKRRLDSATRALSEPRGEAMPPSSYAPGTSSLPPGASPIVPPPGVA